MSEIATALGTGHPTVTRAIEIAQANGGKMLIPPSDVAPQMIFYAACPRRKGILAKTEINGVKVVSGLTRRAVTAAPPALLLEAFNDRGVRRPASLAHYLQSVPPTPSLELVEHRRH